MKRRASLSILPVRITLRPGFSPIFSREPFYDHPHAGVGGEKLSMDREAIAPELPMTAAAREVKKCKLRDDSRVESISAEINETVYDTVGVTLSTRNQIRQEIFLRTSESPKSRDPDPESIPEVPENIDEQVKDLVHHFAMEAVRE